MRAPKFEYSKSKTDHNLQPKIQMSWALDLFCHKKKHIDKFEGPELAFLVAQDYFMIKTPMDIFKSWQVC